MIGVFDSGFGGLTILNELARTLPQYDLVYLGDNARAPYGGRSFHTIYQYTRQAVHFLMEMGCPLVILACNTASARALRSIQQVDLPFWNQQKQQENRVLGVLRPMVEAISDLSVTGHVGILGTRGTVESRSYPLEISKYAPGLNVSQQACPMWVPLVENGEQDTAGARFFVQRDLDALLQNHAEIDTLVLGCTHYPLLKTQIAQSIPPQVRLVEQGPIVAQSTLRYLERHPEMEKRLKRGGLQRFLTTDTPEFFSEGAARFLGRKVEAEGITLIL